MTDLWRSYRRSRDQALRDRLILTYAPLVKYVAGRLGSGLPAHVDEGDLVSYGLLGLIGSSSLVACSTEPYISDVPIWMKRSSQSRFISSSVSRASAIEVCVPAEEYPATTARPF